MPHTQPLNMIVIKKDGTQTHPPMTQMQGTHYLENLLTKDCYGNLKQCLNQAFEGDGKATGNYKHNNNAILHASSGKLGQEKGVTIFYYMNGTTMMLVAMGEHKGNDSYVLNTYGQPSGSFKENAKIQL